MKKTLMVLTAAFAALVLRARNRIRRGFEGGYGMHLCAL